MVQLGPVRCPTAGLRRLGVPDEARTCQVFAQEECRPMVPVSDSPIPSRELRLLPRVAAPNLRGRVGQSLKGLGHQGDELVFGH